MSDNQNLVFSGFFNSYNNNDRLYNAEHFNKFFDGIISDGVYVNYPADENDLTEKAFYVKPGTGLQVTVAKGRAWLLNTYTYTESSLIFELDPTTISAYSRIDAIVIDVNKSDEVRVNDIIVVKGTEASTPDRPALIEQPNHTQFPIAFVTIPGGATSLSQSNIAYTVGTDDEDAIPAVEALLEIASKSKKELQDQINAIKTPTFAEAEAVTNINSGDNINTIWGKIKKMFSTIIAGLPISMGGTGATTRENALTNLGIPQNVADAMSKQIYCSQDENKSIVDLAHGGTGSNDGTINGVKVMKSGSTYGYVKEGETNITPFRNPTGNAAAGDVLSGKTFANASSDALTGSMYNYSGSNRRTVTPSAGTGNEQLSLSAGYHDSVIVNRTNPYNKGKTDAEAVTWTEDVSWVLYTGSYYYDTCPILIFPCFNVNDIKFQITNTSGMNFTPSNVTLGYAYTDTITYNSGLFMRERITRDNNPGYTFFTGMIGTNYNPVQLPTPNKKYLVLRLNYSLIYFYGYLRMTFQNKKLR